MTLWARSDREHVQQNGHAAPAKDRTSDIGVTHNGGIDTMWKEIARLDQFHCSGARLVSVDAHRVSDNNPMG